MKRNKNVQLISKMLIMIDNILICYRTQKNTIRNKIKTYLDNKTVKLSYALNIVCIYVYFFIIIQDKANKKWSNTL